jgi:thiol-disulfide isomerase/thioredoxin
VKYKSEKLTSLEFSALRRFVAGVVAGKVSKVIKSEPVPKASPTPPPVVTAVGSNVVKTVSQRGKDVLLVVFAPWCTHCKDLLPTYEILGRAVQGESRIVIAKINGAANDIPASWGVKAYPTLLWFRASDKETAGGEPVDSLQPHPYWDAGYSLFELVGFVQRHSSFEVRSLRVASNEQLGALLGDEEVLRAQYELDERHELRNAGRHVYGHSLQDYLLGEVVFDGKRWHVALMAISGLVSVVLSAHLVYLKLTNKPKRKNN